MRRKVRSVERKAWVRMVRIVGGEGGGERGCGVKRLK